MPQPTDALFTPPSSYSPQKTLSRLDFRPDPFSDDALDPDIFNMAGSGSPTPYIKEEHDDFTHNNFISQSGFSMNSFGNQQFSAPHESGSGINPSDLTMSGSMSMNNHFGGSNGYIAGGAGIADDELADSLGNFEQHQGFDAFGQNDRSHQQDFFQPGSHVIGSHQNINHQIYSNTPDDAPIQSPFVNPNGFDFNQYHNRHPMGFSGSMQGSQARPRISMSRLPSDNRSPMSPKTPAISNLHLGTPDSGNFSSQPIMASRMHGHKPSMSSTQWDGTPGSGHSNSWVDSPSSPHGGNLQHHQISEVMHSSKHASLPTKVDMGQTQDAKKRRRRESHNLVERRRRDNINERIHDLSRLVPQHRLEDEKIRKHINNNGPLSPTLGATGMSPPQATSLLAGGAGRRAAGNITQGLPLEEKDKGPNKGDILNGAVSWTRDLMWLLYKMTQERDEMQARLQQLSPGENWEPDQTEEVRRMRTELVDAVEKNGFSTFKYSRGPGSGLRVPKHTNLAGDPLNHTPQSLSPDMQSGGSGSNINANSNSHQYWTTQSLKEEDENFMELN